jgi:beta-glucosidase/6-phospho-beta-glucosidase/beta-galactosidase
MFKSFFLGGFEGSTGFNRHRQWIDQISATQHDRFADEDYALLNKVGIRAVRESVRWPLVDTSGRYDFSSLEPFLSAAENHDIELIYDLFHFGFPEYIDLCSEDFPSRFAEYCYAVADYLSRYSDLGSCFTPINEPSFFSWAAGEVGLFAPHLTCRGSELKINLIRGALAGIEAIRSAFPEARIINIDPICRVAPPMDRPDLQGEAEFFNNNAVFESWDMLSGRLHPELGGSPNHLGIIGINYYWTNQWELGRPGVPLQDDDPRRWSLGDLIRTVWDRYGAEIVITETGHVDRMRPIWLRELSQEAESVIRDGLPLHGVCLYPVLGMPEWHQRDEWTNLGLWDLKLSGRRLKRVPYEPAIRALRKAQKVERLNLRGRTMFSYDDFKSRYLE